MWWAWEQWHLLGYDLPLNWGNAADWIVDAERVGLPLGTLPRPGSIAAFPRGDGVWAFGPAGHVAFVTWVSPDGGTFNVTYQNYGDPTPMLIGRGYNVSIINEPRFQNGEMRFIYFPRPIDPVRFSHLPGMNGNSIGPEVNLANSLLKSSITLGLPPGSVDQGFNADFTGIGYTDLLVYNRQKGRLDILTFSDRFRQTRSHFPHPTTEYQPMDNSPQRVSLSDANTPINGWGSSLDIHIGDFTGSGRSEILLYDRVTGELQLISLTPQLKIQKHLTFPGWGPGWELVVGQFDGKRSGVFMYNPFAFPNPVTTPGTTPSSSPSNSPTSSSSKPSPTPSVKPSPTACPTPSPTPNPSPSLTPSPTACPTPIPTPSPTSSPKPSPTPSPTSSPKPSPTPSPTPGSSHSPTPTGTTGAKLDIVHTTINTVPKPGQDLSGIPLQAWETQGRMTNILVFNFKNEFSINQEQQYTLWHDAWEVYVGRFANPHQDGIFLYDRIFGEARIMAFNNKMVISQYQQIHNLPGNWEVHSGDFNGSGRAQLLLYDTSSGDAQILRFGSNLSLIEEKSISGWGTNQVLYVGHFGQPSLSVMLYNPQAGQSTFIAFDSSLRVIHRFTISSWDQNSQVLVGAFLDRSRCLATHTCSTGDDILVLNRKTGLVKQYIFSFGNKFKVFDNRAQAFLREGAVSIATLSTTDATSFSLATTLDTGIHSEELY